ncbi:MAG: M23 family metallopeptidase [Clostridia bacterium]|jgi:murein DD-endopeptidase MepM/ murein hydrolase activator NlpD|nr:M23 family metallopeptidase [Clostridia bacterium]
MENEKLMNKIKDKIAISNFEWEEKTMINKKKKMLSIVSISIICIMCSFATVNAMTGNELVKNIEKTISKLFHKENITMNYGESGITSNVDEVNSEIGSKQEIKHNGVDLKAEYGEEVLVIAEGEVIEAKYDQKMGYYILVKHNNSEFTYTKYAHLSKLNVKAGDTVKKDEKIGEAGQTGMVTGVCLHFEVLDKDMNAMDPNKFLN